MKPPPRDLLYKFQVAQDLQSFENRMYALEQAILTAHEKYRSIRQQLQRHRLTK